MKQIFAFTLMVILLTACRAQPGEPQTTIETSVGQEFKVVIAYDPSTGYHWEIVGKLDERIVEFVARDYRSDQPVNPGSGGSDIFTFGAVGAGETTITLGLYPPSTDVIEPEQTRTFKVIVK